MRDRYYPGGLIDLMSLSRRTGCGPTTLSRWEKKGLIPSVKGPTGKTLFDLKSVNQAIDLRAEKMSSFGVSMNTTLYRGKIQRDLTIEDRKAIYQKIEARGVKGMSIPVLRNCYASEGRGLSFANRIEELVRDEVIAIEKRPISKGNVKRIDVCFAFDEEGRCYADYPDPDLARQITQIEITRQKIIEAGSVGIKYCELKEQYTSDRLSRFFLTHVKQLQSEGFLTIINRPRVPGSARTVRVLVATDALIEARP